MNALTHNTIAMLVQLYGAQMQEQERQHEQQIALLKQQLKNVTLEVDALRERLRSVFPKDLP